MIQLQVKGMSCQHCVNAVTSALQEIDAAATVRVNLAANEVLVSSTASLDDVREAVEDAGYPVTDARVLPDESRA
ncbi:MAG: cation transporter [Burkholderiaceae bacterium]